GFSFGGYLLFRVSDVTPPQVACAMADGTWHASNVTLACSATDAGSGLANGGDTSFTLTTNVAAGTQDANAATDFHTVCDNANNCATVGPIAGNRIDRHAPTITISAPA